jgi:hypothetical protein
MLQAGRLRVRFLIRSFDLSMYLIPSSRAMILGSTESLTEINTRNLSGVVRPASQSDCLENMGVSTSHKLMGFIYRDIFTFYGITPNHPLVKI